VKALGLFKLVHNDRSNRWPHEMEAGKELIRGAMCTSCEQISSKLPHSFSKFEDQPARVQNDACERDMLAGCGQARRLQSLTIKW
jgi:hypothetical protein